MKSNRQYPKKTVFAFALVASLAVGVPASKYQLPSFLRSKSEASPLPVPGEAKPVLQEIPGRFSRSGIIASSLWDSMAAQGIPDAIILQAAATLETQVDFLTEVRNGDRYSIIWTEDSSSGKLKRTVQAFVYDGAETGRENAFVFDGAYYDEKGRSLKRQFLRAPISLARVTSRFSKRRFHPVLRIYRPHHGTDYKAACGTPVSVVGDGVVTFAGWRGGLGRYIEVRHSSVYTTGYGHLSSFSKKIRRGARVVQGQVIAYSGKTGLVSGPHLHFQITRNGKYIDFRTLKAKNRAVSLDRARLSEFRRAMSALSRALDAALASLPAPSYSRTARQAMSAARQA